MKESESLFTTQEDLKRFFRNQIKALHPDKGGNAEEYKKFIEWYQERLRNLKKETSIKVLKNYIPQGNSFYKIEEFSVKELALALPKRVKIPVREIQCHFCKGHGVIKNSQKELCPACNGRGSLLLKRSEGDQIELPCSFCNGCGYLFKEPCPKCLGKGKIKEERLLEIKIPPGVREGDILYISGESLKVNWNIYLEVVQSPHPYFKLEKDKLYYELKIPFTDLLLKETIKIETLEGWEDVPTMLFRKGEPVVLPGRGPFLPEGSLWQRGDFIINIRVLFPEKIPPEAKKILENFLKVMEVNKNGESSSTNTFSKK